MRVSASREQVLIAAVQSGCVSSGSIGDELVQGFEPLVRSIARPLVAPADLEDAVQGGFAGLLEAARRFKPHRGARLVSYAYGFIKKGILAAVYGGLPPKGDDVPAITSYEATRFGDGEQPDGEPWFLGHEDRAFAEIEDRDAVRAILDQITDEERLIVVERVAGATQAQIAEAIGTYQVDVSRRISKIATKAKEVMAA